MFLFIVKSNIGGVQVFVISIHLMFLFIVVVFVYIMYYKGISIHLMFLFIHLFLLSSLRKPLFQYISCSYLSTSYTTPFVIVLISIHLMFLFIHTEDLELLGIVEFQYISCSYLSKRKKTVRVKKANFNTSHVLIYL